MFRPLHSLILILSLAIGGLAQSSVSSEDSGMNSAVEANAIRLVLETSKAIYLEGEPLVITAYLENTGRRPYYVGNTLAGLFGRESNHYMNLKIFDAKGKEVGIGHGGGVSLWKQGTPVAEKISRAYVYLQAGNIHGVKERLEWDFAPGRYRLTATYRELEALAWTEEESKSLIRPVWVQPLISNTVWIRIRQRKSGFRGASDGRPNKRLQLTAR